MPVWRDEAGPSDSSCPLRSPDRRRLSPVLPGISPAAGAGPSPAIPPEPGEPCAPFPCETGSPPHPARCRESPCLPHLRSNSLGKRHDSAQVTHCCKRNSQKLLTVPVVSLFSHPAKQRTLLQRFPAANLRQCESTAPGNAASNGSVH